MNEQAHFSLVDQFWGIRLGVDFSDLKPHRVTVVESPRRLRMEQSYGFIHALWWIWLEDGRSVVSLPPGAGAGVERVLKGTQPSQQIFDPDIVERLKSAMNDAISQTRLKPMDRVRRNVSFACNAPLLRLHRHGDCRRLVDERIPPADGLRLPTHCFPDGIAYGIIAADRIVSVASAHRTGVMEGQVADLGVDTASGYRRQGYAKTVVSAVVEHMVGQGGEALYESSPENQASIATAQSVGFVPYGKISSISSPGLE